MSKIKFNAKRKLDKSIEIEILGLKRKIDEGAKIEDLNFHIFGSQSEEIKDFIEKYFKVKNPPNGINFFD